MTASTWVSIAAALISSLSLLVAWRALGNGKRSAAASEKSAATAQRAVDGAEQERIRQIQESEKVQASKVSAWRTYPGSSDGMNPPSLIGMSVQEQVHNTSQEPVFDVIIVTGEGEEPPYTANDTQIAVLMPASRPRIISDYEIGEDESLLSRVDMLRTYFTDSAGRRWMRDTKGRLHRQ